MPVAGSDGVMTRVFFFKGARTVGYHRGEDRVDIGPSPVKELFPALAAQGFNPPDAAINLGNGSVYFFKGRDYVRWDIRTRTLDLLRVPNRQGWNGFDKCELPNGKTFADSIDAALNWWNGKGVTLPRRSLHPVQPEEGSGRSLDSVVPIAKEWNGFAERRARLEARPSPTASMRRSTGATARSTSSAATPISGTTRSTKASTRPGRRKSAATT